MQRPVTALLCALAVGASSCASGQEPATSTTVEATTTVPTTSTTATTTTTTTTEPAPTTTKPPRVGDYEVVDDYVVETTASGIDAATGGLAIDAEGNLYHADFGYPDHTGDTIFLVRPDGTVTPYVTSDLMRSLTGSASGTDGTLYQSSFGSGDVLRISPEGEVDLVTDALRGPTAIVATGDGRLFVADCRGNSIYEVGVDGEATVLAGGVGLDCPNGMTIDPDGNLYIVNFGAGFVHRLSPDGELEIIFRLPAASNHVVYWEGFLFITARTLNRVLRYDIASGEIVVIAGTGEPGAQDGVGSQATIARPNAIIVGPDGTLYINHGSDSSTNNPTTIRTIRLADG